MGNNPMIQTETHPKPTHNVNRQPAALMVTLQHSADCVTFTPSRFKYTPGYLRLRHDNATARTEVDNCSFEPADYKGSPDRQVRHSLPCRHICKPDTIAATSEVVHR
jgi:hypothetical protein